MDLVKIRYIAFGLVFILLCLIRYSVLGVANDSEVVEVDEVNSDFLQVKEVNDTNEEVEESKDSPIFLSTLDGTLIAVSRNTGKTLWTLKEDPVLKTPLNIHKSPMFLTNPKDGSLYMYSKSFTNLKKLPFTIPDLVTASPCKSTDGILYTGYKKDTWFVIDPVTGKKLQTLDLESLQNDICPSSSDSSILVGRTEYSLVMYDSSSKEVRWNATFMDYSSHVSVDNGALDGVTHFTSSSGGAVVALDNRDGSVVWTTSYESPVVAIYSLDSSGGLGKIPFISVAGETLEHLTGKVTSMEWRDRKSVV